MSGTVPAAVAACCWLAIGGWGASRYTHDYEVYRGFPPPRDAPGVRPGHVERATFWSPALHARRGYEIFVPPPAPGRTALPSRMPVLYLLHGSPGSPALFVTAGAAGVALDTLVAKGTVRPFFVVMPNGRNGTFRSDTEWANTTGGRYESFVIDVVRAVDRRWPTLADRAHRAIAGDSEGGYAAVNVGLHHLRLFSTVESWSGYFTQTRSGAFARATPAEVRANSPSDEVRSLARRLRALPLRAYLYGGTKDKGTRQIEPFARRLRAAGAHVVARAFPGRHDWRLWRGRMPAMLRFAARGLGASS